MGIYFQNGETMFYCLTIQMKFFRHTLIGGFLFLLISIAARAQDYNSSHIFAHNDYVRAVPFFTAYELQVGYIEADVFLDHGDLSVAHHTQEIQPGRTLESLYLKPLLAQVRRNDGFAYKDSLRSLVLMIDLKTEGTSTLQAVADLLATYPELINCRTLKFMISGSVPDPGLWMNYPSYIYFDGRPGIRYTPEQWKKIHMISTSFGQHMKWNGHGQLPEAEIIKTKSLMNEAHAHGKTFRFWGTPDFENAWQQFMSLQMDVVVTDDVTGLMKFLEQR